MDNVVYVLNRGAHDYSDATRFGEIVYCTDGSMDRYDLNQMYRELNEAMYASHPDDFILLTSLTSLCSVACAIFATKHKRLNLLIHKDTGYIVRSIVLNNV